MTLPAPTIVIFDMDGTTVRHTNPRLLNWLERLDDLAYRVSRIAGWLFVRRARGPMFFDAEKIALQKKPRLLVHRALHTLRRKPVEEIVEPCPGIYGVLGTLKSRGVLMALASNGLGKGYGHDVLAAFDLVPYFSATIFREDITRSKPDPESLLLALARLGRDITAQDVVWYIGDRHKDITAAQAAQKQLPCRVVPIAHGLNAALAVLEKGYGTEHIQMSFYDLDIALNEIFMRAGCLGAPDGSRRSAA